MSFNLVTLNMSHRKLKLKFCQKKMGLFLKTKKKNRKKILTHPIHNI